MSRGGRRQAPAIRGAVRMQHYGTVPLEVDKESKEARMIEMIKHYFTSGNLFMDLLFIACFYCAVIVYVPHIVRSMISGVVAAKLGTFDIRSQPFKYIFMMIFTFLHFLMFGFGGFAIAWRRYFGY